MFEIDTISLILIASAPTISAICTILAGIFAVIKSTKTMKINTQRQLDEATQKLEKAYNNIAVIKAKAESIEKRLNEEKEQRK